MATFKIRKNNYKNYLTIEAHNAVIALAYLGEDCKEITSEIKSVIDRCGFDKMPENQTMWLSSDSSVIEVQEVL